MFVLMTPVDRLSTYPPDLAAHEGFMTFAEDLGLVEAWNRHELARSHAR